MSKIVGPTHKAAIATSKDQLNADRAAFRSMEGVQSAKTTYESPSDLQIRCLYVRNKAINK